MSAKRKGDFPSLSVKKVKHFDKETEEKFRNEGGAPKRKTSARDRLEVLKADAKEKAESGKLYPGEEKTRSKLTKDPDLQSLSPEERKLIKQLPTDEGGYLPEWDPETMGNDYCIAIFGKRRTGKTWIARHLLWLKRNVFNHGLVITKTKFNGFWRQPLIRIIGP